MARNKKAKEYASLAAQADTVGPTNPVAAAQAKMAETMRVEVDKAAIEAALPPVEPWVEGDLKLRQLANRIETDYLEFCELARHVQKEGWHTRFGYVDIGDYFEERIGLSYRTLRRRFAVLEAIEKLPPAEQAEARATMVELGSHKAAALAPMLGQEGTDWREASDFARRATEDAVQNMVSEKLGRPHRGLPASQHPGDRFLGYLLNVVPPEEHDRTEWVFQELMKIAGSHNPMAVFLVLVGLGEQELAAHGKTRE